MKDAQRSVTGTNGHIVCGCRVRVELSPIEEKRKSFSNRGSPSLSSRGRGPHSFGSREHDSYTRGSRFQRSLSPPTRRFNPRSSRDEPPVQNYSRGGGGNYDSEREYGRSVSSYSSESESYRGRGSRDSYHHHQRARPPPPHPPPPPKDDYPSHSSARQPIQRFSTGGGRGRPSYEARPSRDHGITQYRHKPSRGEDYNVRRNSYETNRTQDISYRSQRSSRLMGRGGMDTSYRGTSTQGRPYSHVRPMRGHSFGGQNKNGWSGDNRGRQFQSRRRYSEGNRQGGERGYRGRSRSPGERKDRQYVQRHSPHGLVMYSSEDSPPYAEDSNDSFREQSSPHSSPPLAFSRSEKSSYVGRDREGFQEECYHHPPSHHTSRSHSPRELAKEVSTSKYIAIDDRYSNELSRDNFEFDQGSRRYENEEEAYLQIDEVKDEGRATVYVDSPTNHHYYKEHDIAVYSPGRDVERQVVAHTSDRERVTRWSRNKKVKNASARNQQGYNGVPQNESILSSLNGRCRKHRSRSGTPTLMD